MHDHTHKRQQRYAAHLYDDDSDEEIYHNIKPGVEKGRKSGKNEEQTRKRTPSCTRRCAPKKCSVPRKGLCKMPQEVVGPCRKPCKTKICRKTSPSEQLPCKPSKIRYPQGCSDTKRLKNSCTPSICGATTPNVWAAMSPQTVCTVLAPPPPTHVCRPCVCAPSICTPPTCNPSTWELPECNPGECIPSLCIPKECIPSMCTPKECIPSVCTPKECTPSVCRPLGICENTNTPSMCRSPSICKNTHPATNLCSSALCGGGSLLCKGEEGDGGLSDWERSSESESEDDGKSCFPRLPCCNATPCVCQPESGYA